MASGNVRLKNTGFAKDWLLPFVVVLVLQIAFRLAIGHFFSNKPLLFPTYGAIATAASSLLIFCLFGFRAPIVLLVLVFIIIDFFLISARPRTRIYASDFDFWAAFAIYFAILFVGSLAIAYIENARKRLSKLNEELLVKNKRLDMFITNSPLSVIQWDPDFRIIDWSPESERIFGWKKEEVLGKHPDEFKFVYEEDIQPVAQIMYDLTHGVSQRSTFFNRNYCKDGRVIWCQWYNSALVDDDGKLRSIFSFTLDVTEREKALLALKQREELFRSMAESAPDIIARYGTDTTHIYVGPLIEKATGLIRSQVLGKKLLEIGKAERLMPMHNAILNAVQKGEAQVTEFSLDSPEGIRHYEARLIPEKDTDGKVVSVLGISRDITEKRRIAQLNEALNLINTTVNSTLDFDKIIRRVVQSAAVALECESAGMTLTEDGKWTVKYTYKMPVDLTGYVFEQDELPRGMDISAWREPLEIGDGKELNFRNIKALERLKIRSCLAVPLMLRNRQLGAMLFCYHSQNYDFQKAEIDFAKKLSVSVSLALENARLYGDQKELAKKASEAQAAVQQHYELLQRALVPEKPVTGEGYSVAAEYIPAYGEQDIGGDFYDVFHTESGNLGVLIGDVAGKGIGTAALAAVTRSTVRAFAFDFSDASEALSHANRVIVRHQEGSESFVTVCLAIIDVRSGQFAYSCAGHPPAAICRKNGDVEFLAFGQPPLGLVENQRYRQLNFKLDKGDKLIFYTDGIMEAHCKGDIFGTEGIEKILRQTCGQSLDVILKSIIKAAKECSEGNLSDDAAVVIVSLE